MVDWWRLAPVALLLAFVAVPAPSSAADAAVQVRNFAFDPDEVALEPGDTVTWTWASGTHSVIEDGTGVVWCTTRSTPAASCARAFPGEGVFAYHCGVHPTLMKARVVVGTPPEVAIAAPAAGATVSGDVTVAGMASHASGISKVEVRFDQGAFVAAMGTTSWSATLDSLGLTEGAHTIEAKATAANGLFATATVTVTVDNPDTFDLRFISVFGNVGTIGLTPGQTVITLRFANDGNAATAGTAAFEYAYKDQWFPIGTSAFTVAAKTTSSVTHAWQDASLVGRFTVRATLDPDHLVDELSEANNVGTGTASFTTNRIEGVDLDDP